MSTVGRRVYRNHRFQAIGVLSLLFAAGLAVLTYIVFTSPARSVDHPGGFTAGPRVLAGFACVLALITFVVYAVGAFRVALILDEDGMVIRNQLRTTTVGWGDKPRFAVRGREQDVTVIAPRSASGPLMTGNMTYRYRAVECIVGRQHTWIAATSRMTRRSRVDQQLEEIRQVVGQLRQRAATERVND